MKKIFTVILTFALLLAACGAKAPAETEPIETSPNYPGTWKIDHLRRNNSSFTQSELEAMDIEAANMQFVLKDGGKAYLILGPQSGITDWSETKTGILLENQPLTLEDEYLSLKIDDNNTLLFQKVSESQIVENTVDPTEDTLETIPYGDTSTNETEPVSSTEETEPTDTEATTALVDGMRPEFKEAMDAYEAFYDEYCSFMTKFQQNPSDFSLLAQYAGMLTKAGEASEAFQSWDQNDLNSEELKYYLAVNSRVLQKMANIMG